MQLKLYRPLNTMIVELETELGLKFFLIDSGCPVSFATHAKEIVSGGWFKTEPVQLMPAPFSLNPICERLGVPIEGFIGLKELIKQWRIYIDFDQSQILLGDSAPFIADDDEDAVTLSLTKIKGSPVGVTGSLDLIDGGGDASEDHSFYLDTGSRFVVLPKSAPVIREDHPLLCRLDLVTPQGALPVEVSASHRFSVQLDGARLESAPICVATGAPEGFPMILGTEWLCEHNCLISFENRTLTLIKRKPRKIESWERLSAYMYGPQLEFTFDPTEYDKLNRSFSILRRSDHPLPDGLNPFTRYRLYDFVIPPGVEGINRLFSQVFSEDNELVTELDFVDENSREIMITMRKMFI